MDRVLILIFSQILTCKLAIQWYNCTIENVHDARCTNLKPKIIPLAVTSGTCCASIESPYSRSLIERAPEKAPSCTEIFDRNGAPAMTLADRILEKLDEIVADAGGVR